MAVINGDANDNNLFGTNQADIIAGGAGRDLLFARAGHDYLDGGAGDDIMIGGIGNDIYVVDSIHDFVFEDFNHGIDEVRSWVDFSFYGNPGGTYLENLTLLGSAIIGVGNELNNVIRGTSGHNAFIGFGGDDTLLGFGGDDGIDGDDGNDPSQRRDRRGHHEGRQGQRHPRRRQPRRRRRRAASRGHRRSPHLDQFFPERRRLQGEHREFEGLTGSAAINAPATLWTTISSATGLPTCCQAWAATMGFSGGNGDDHINGGSGDDTLVGVPARTSSLAGPVTTSSTEAPARTRSQPEPGPTQSSSIRGSARPTSTRFPTSRRPQTRSSWKTRSLPVWGLGELDARAFFIGPAAADADDRIIYDDQTGRLFFDPDGVGGGAGTKTCSVRSTRDWL